MQLAKRLPLIRFWIALAISITVFPFLWHKLIVRWLVVGTLSVEAIGVNVAVGLFVALLVSRQRVDYAFPKIVLCMLLWSAWIVIAVLLLKKRVDTRSPMLPVAMALAATNCGVITLAWLFWFEARRVAWSVLGIVFLLPFWILFQPKGMYGDGKSVVDWRSFSTTASLTTPIESTPIANKQAIDYPFLGPNRDAVIPGLRLKSDWSTSPPEVQWRGAIGAGWSGLWFRRVYLSLISLS